MKRFKTKTVLAKAKILLATAILASTPLWAQANSAFAQDFMLVVNASNSASADSVESEIKNLYLKKKTKWSSGSDAVPLARPTDSAEHQAFSQSVLGMSQSDLDSYWAAEKSKTGQTSPREIGSDNILLRQVSRKDGAFGVVSSATDLPDGVKVLKKF